MEDRRILEAEATASDLDEQVSRIAEEFRQGFEAVDRIPKPAVTIFGSGPKDTSALVTIGLPTASLRRASRPVAM